MIIDYTDIGNRVTDDTPKKILSLDGGGIKGIISLVMLEKLELILKEKSELGDRFRLNSYFDLIGGTSTGAIIATLLSLGWKVSEITTLYTALGEKIFGRKSKTWYNKLSFGIIPGYKAEPLTKLLQEHLGDTTLSDAKISNILSIVTKRLETNSPWFIFNHPNAKFYSHNHDNDNYPNKDYKLWELLRASSAAPVYFPSQKLNLTASEQGTFVDGGVSTANNPALHLLMQATLPQYKVEWPTGDKKLLLVSVGTGIFPTHMGTSQLDVFKNLPHMYMADSSSYNQMILQSMSNGVNHTRIDSELGDLKDILFTTEAKFSYIRYNIDFQMFKNLKREDLYKLSKMDDYKNISKLKSLASEGLEMKSDTRHYQHIIKGDHFTPAFDYFYDIKKNDNV